MDKSLKVSESISINGTAEQVWDAVTNPTKIKEYMFGTEAVSSWKTGDEITFQGEYQGQQYKDKGLIKQSKPNETLQYDYWSAFTGLADAPENYSEVTFQIASKEGVSTLSLDQVGFASAQSHEHSSVAWKNVLEKIKEIVERG